MLPFISQLAEGDTNMYTVIKRKMFRNKFACHRIKSGLRSDIAATLAEILSNSKRYDCLYVKVSASVFSRKTLSPKVVIKYVDMLNQDGDSRVGYELYTEILAALPVKNLRTVNVSFPGRRFRELFIED